MVRRTWVRTSLCRAAALVASASLVAGCHYTLGSPRPYVKREDRPTAVVLRTDRLPGEGSLDKEGALQFSVPTDQLCRRDQLVVETKGRIRTPVLDTGSKVLWALGIAAPLLLFGSIIVLSASDLRATGSTDDPPDDAGIALMIGSIVGGVGSVTLIVGAATRKHGPTDPQPTTTFTPSDEPPRVLNQGTTYSACPAEVPALRTLTARAPWGATYTATTSLGPRGESLARFPVVWDDSVPRDQLATPWQISSPELPLVAAWTPRPADVSLATRLVDQSASRVVTGAVPAQLEASLAAAGGALVVGRAAYVTLTLKNSGGSTALDVTAQTRSSLPGLHGLRASFPRIHPGASASQRLRVDVPADTSGDEATVLVTFSEKNDHAPQDLSLRLSLSRSICPEGVLSRERYDFKRAKLKANLDAGNTTRAEFDKLDADLLRCLE